MSTSRSEFVRLLAKRYREKGNINQDVDITEWNFEAETLLKIVIHLANEALKLALDEDAFIEPHNDGDTVTIVVPLGSDEYCGPQWSFSLSSLMDMEISVTDEEHVLSAWRSNMLKQVKKIDEAIVAISKEKNRSPL